jgi:hypothetical protein
MTCQELDARLDDWLDGALAPAEAAAVEAHLASCAACREAEQALRQVLAHAAALPRSLAPSRDLWPGVERRIAHGLGWSWLLGPGQPLALAAAAVVAIGVGAVLWRQQAPAAVRTAEIPVAGGRFEPVSAGPAVADPDLARAERDYEAAANALLDALQTRKAQLPAEELARVEGNLQVIDRALGEVRQALAKDPENVELNRMLVRTHRKKVDVLRQVVRLSTAL